MPLRQPRRPAARTSAAAAVLTALAAAGCGSQPAPPAPLTAAQLTAARAAAGRFTALYGTRAYRQPAVDWLARLAPLDTPALQARLATAPGLAGGQAAVTSKATVTAVRAITGASVTFLVRAAITTTAPGSGTAGDQDYAVTVTLSAGTWQAASISPVPAVSRK
jgi:hypothetical protein